MMAQVRERAAVDMTELRIRLAEDGTVLCVPDSLSSMTTYVLLEQERWFEKEVAFVRRFLKPGTVAIDIGANYGAYAIPMARAVGPKGVVVAYEPSSSTRNSLEDSRHLNDVKHLKIMPFAVSDRTGEALLSIGASSELNTLGAGGTGETVRLTTLDVEDEDGRWPRPPDFIKLDAEGEEERILAGAQRFFARHSPLVMFEVKAGNAINRSLPQRFRELGFDLYRMHPGAIVLVNAEPEDSLDTFEINLFAAKPDRAAALAADNLLVHKVPDFVAPTNPEAVALGALRAIALNKHLTATTSLATLDTRYLAALSAYGTWRSLDGELAMRLAALDDAVSRLRTLCAASPTLPRLATLARASLEAGKRTVAVEALTEMIKRIEKGDSRLTEPFWPAASRLDGVEPGKNFAQWFLASVLEPFETSRAFSSYFVEPAIDLANLSLNPFVSAEIVRRYILTLARSGLRPQVPQRLRVKGSDLVNASLWSRGGVPGTLTGKR